MTLSVQSQPGAVFGLREWLSKAPGRAAVFGVALVVHRSRYRRRDRRDSFFEPADPMILGWCRSI